MKGKAKIGILLMVFGLFGGKVSATSQERFWRWFTENESRLFSFEGNQEAVFNELGAEMKKVNSDLTFEFGPVEPTGKREFVISAGGIKSAFPAVELLYESAPDLNRWSWVKYRPRRQTLMDINFAGKSIRVDDVHYLLARHEDKPGILLFFDGYNDEESNTFGQIGFLLLDQALGEYAVETQVGFIEFHSRESKYFERALPLRELPVHFDAYRAQQVH